jgi:N-acetylglucosamine-6-sulfatase
MAVFREVFLVLLLTAAAVASKPNIVYVLTDDQDVKLGSLDALPVLKSLMTDQGLYFDNAFVTTPVCCPSRSSILTGKYTHNHHTYENTVERGCDAPSWRTLNENKTMGPYMSMAGYKTGYFGKYLNNYGEPDSGVDLSHIPPGWTRWFTLQGNSKYYNYSVSNQGVKETHGDNYTLDYFTDVIKAEAVKFIEESSETPIFMYIATPAPHRPATPAPQYESKFVGQVAPRSPSYNFDSKDKHWIISEGTPVMTKEVIGLVDELYEMRLETLLSVQDLLEAVVGALEKQKVLNNTYIFFNSDHGYHLGQFKQQGEKRQPYEEDIRVPLIVRGPGIKPNTTTQALALSIDMAATFLDLAGWPLPEDMDGQSLKPILLGEEPAETNYQFLVEYFGAGTSPGVGCFYYGPYVPFLHDCVNNTFLSLRMHNSQNGDQIFSDFFSTDAVPMSRSDIYFREYYNITEVKLKLHSSFWVGSMCALLVTPSIIGLLGAA